MDKGTKIFIIGMFLCAFVSFSLWRLNVYLQGQIEENEEVELITPVAPVEPEIDEWDDYLSSLNEVERAICEKFGVKNCQVALAVSEAENSGRNFEAWNFNTNGTLDVGLFQVNQTHWDTEYCPYGLHELTTMEPNIECAYNIWDRADGVEGNNEGKWSPWTQFNNGVFLNNL